MSFFSRLLGLTNSSKKQVRNDVTQYAPSIDLPSVGTLPTVRFDASVVDHKIETGLEKNIRAFREFDKSNFNQIYTAAITSIRAGRDLGVLSKSIQDLKIPGMTKSRAGEISTVLHNKATALINAGRRGELGITHAIWCYSSVPCRKNMKNPTNRDLARDEAHKGADGKKFKADKGLFLNSKWTHPGYEDGCRCYSKSIIPGLHD